MPHIASFHLVRHHRAVDAMAHLATARPLLRRVPGLRFSRVLGTGRGADTGPSADLQRTGLFAVWESETELDDFLAAPMGAWEQAAERYDVRLRGLGGHGSWRGVDVLTGLEPGEGGGRIAVVTRADIRPHAWRRFAAAAPAISAELAGTPGLLAVAGVGELPVGRLGTFSLWSETAAMRAFVASPAHAEVARRAREEDWFGEELFARFEPYGSSGTWGGRDPLAG
jgi:heme-degrading monooxygenase HmoA